MTYESWEETDLEFKNNCPHSMELYIKFLRWHHGYSDETIHKYFNEYVNLIRYGIIRIGHTIFREKI